MSKKPVWISETAAAKMIGYKPAVLRKYAKSGKIDVSYFTIRGRLYQYNQLDIERIIEQHSTVLR